MNLREFLIILDVIMNGLQHVKNLEIQLYGITLVFLQFGDSMLLLENRVSIDNGLIKML
jgi:hypothetical protein